MLFAVAACRRRVKASRVFFVVISLVFVWMSVNMVFRKQSGKSEVKNQNYFQDQMQHELITSQGLDFALPQEQQNPITSEAARDVALPQITELQRQAMEEVQQERRKRLKDFCISKGLTEPIFGKKIPDLMVDDKDKILLCVTYKVASRQLKRIIGSLTGIKIGRYAPRGLFNWFNQYTNSERDFMAKTYFKFLFVREPLERLLSGFLDKFYREPHPMYRLGYGRKIIKRYRENPSNESLETGNDVKFDEFTQFILDGNRDEHWDRFYKRCHPCALDYDFIGYFEDLQGELPYALQAAGVKDIPMQIPYVTHNTSSRVQLYYSQLSKEKIIELAELYSYDYGLFGYPFPGPLYTDMVGDNV